MRPIFLLCWVGVRIWWHVVSWIAYGGFAMDLKILTMDLQRIIHRYRHLWMLSPTLTVPFGRMGGGASLCGVGARSTPPPQFGGRIWPNLPNWSAELFVTSGIHDVCAPKIFSLNFLFCR